MLSANALIFVIELFVPIVGLGLFRRREVYHRLCIHCVLCRTTNRICKSSVTRASEGLVLSWVMLISSCECAGKWRRLQLRSEVSLYDVEGIRLRLRRYGPCITFRKADSASCDRMSQLLPTESYLHLPYHPPLASQNYNTDPAHPQKHLH